MQQTASNVSLGRSTPEKSPNRRISLAPKLDWSFIKSGSSPRDAEGGGEKSPSPSEKSSRRVSLGQRLDNLSFRRKSSDVSKKNEVRSVVKWRTLDHHVDLDFRF